MTTFVAKAPRMSDLEIDEDFLVFDGEELHRLAGSAADVWRSIRGAVAVGDVIRRLQVLHPGDRNVPGDVRAFIDDLLARGLVEERPTPSDGCSVPSHVAWCVDEDGTAEGRAEHQGPEVDGVTTLAIGGRSLAVGDVVAAVVTESEGVDLVAEVTA